MAFNFAETFLRESGATQDRAQSMAEMQLRAKQFEQNYSLALARQKVAERQQVMLEEAQDFEQTMTTEDRKYYQENIRPLELEEAENTVQQKKYQTELMKVQVDDVNAVMPDDLAQELNMQKGTKWSDAEKILMGRQAIYEQKIRTRAESARASFYGARRASLEKPIETTEVGEFKPADEELGMLGGIGTRIGGFFDFLGTALESGALGAPRGYTTGVKIDPQAFDEFRERKEIREIQRDQDITKEGLERILGKSRPDLLSPIDRNLYNAAVTSGYFTTPASVLNTQATFDLLPQGVSFPSADMNAYIQSLLPAGSIEEE
jgi:hypothetical protein